MSVVPRWLEDVVSVFAAGFGLEKFALNEDGAAGFAFENGVSFRLEYAPDSLALVMSAEPPLDPASVKILLSAADPLRRGAFRIRAGVLGHPLRAILSIRLEAAEITLGNLEGAMAELWRAVEHYRRRLCA
jgi:type III secretion system chaperone SycN